MKQHSLELLLGETADIASNGKPAHLLARLWDKAKQSIMVQRPLNTTSRQTDSTEKTVPLKGIRTVCVPSEVDPTNAAQRLAFFYDLVSQFGMKRELNGSLQTMVEHLVDVIPKATRAALLLRDRESDKLLLQAHVSSDGPAVDMALARCAMEECKGFIWQRNEERDGSDGMTPPETAIYAPLSWQGQVLGVLCIDSLHRDTTFTEEDVQFVSAVARCTAMVIANCQLQDDVQQKATLLERLLKTFSPKIREKLLERVHHGQLRPGGGKKSKVTIFYADIRGFTKMSMGRDAGDIVNILNAYFSPLIKIIFKYDGIIDKFIGDEILAVFGIESDAEHHEKAVRAAWEMQEAVKKLNTERKARGEVICDIGIGVHFGEVLHGFIGDTECIGFTVISDAVNKASRYCDGAGPGEVLISPELYQHVWQMVKDKEDKTIKTKHEGPLTAHRVKDVNL